MRSDFNNIGTMSEDFSTILSSNTIDKKGRVIGFEVTLWDFIDLEENQTFYASIQQVRNGKPFGVRQKGKGFKTESQANSYGYSTAKQRIASQNWKL